MSQPSLFKLHHAADPPTSREAVLQHETSGRRRRNLDRVRAALLRHPDSTGNELAEHLPDLEYLEVRRRLTDLKNQGLAVQGAIRRCAVRGSRMMTWRAK